MAVRVRSRSAADAAVRVPSWAWLSALVVAAAAFYYLLGRSIAAPWIMTDELIYSDAARSFADSGQLLVRNASTLHVPPLYPILISPAYALFDAVPRAYGAAKAINAVAMSLTGVPLYLLARRVLSPASALTAAALGLVVPSVLYTGTLMTENAFYPLFAVVALALVLVLERPTLLRSLVLLTLGAIAFYARPQAVAFAPAVLAAPAVLVLFRRSGLRSLRPYRNLYLLTAVLVLPPLVLQLARGQPFSSLLGRYSFVGTQHYDAANVAKWVVYHFAELDLYVGIVPFAAFLLLVAVARGLPARTQAFLAAAVSLSVCFVITAGAYASALTFVHRVHERYMFYVASLLLIALLVWVENGLPRPRRAATIAALVAAALPALLPLQWMLNVSIVSDTLALIPWWRIDTAIASAAWTRILLVVASFGAAALFLTLPRRARAIIPLFVVAYLGVVTGFATYQWRGAARAALGSIATVQADWIDRAVPAGADAAVLYTGHVPPYPMWETEFFNRAVDAVYFVDEPEPGDLPTTAATIRRRDGLVEADGPVRMRYALADSTAELAGLRLARAGDLTLIRTPGALTLDSLVRGLYPGSSWSGRSVTYTRYACPGGELGVGVTGDPAYATTSKHLVVRTGSRTITVRVAPSMPRALVLPLRARGGACVVRFSIHPVSLLAIPPGTPPRPFGLQFTFP